MEIWKDSTLRVETLNAASARDHFETLARMRIDEFRGYPYLYEGNIAYEKAYFESYFASEGFRALAVFDGARICGMATYIPLANEAAYMTEPFARAGLDVKKYLYLGEGILEKGCRGKGLFRVFIGYAETLRGEFGLEKVVFMAIREGESDVMRPADYRPKAVLFEKFGFEKIPGLQAEMTYKSSVSHKDEPHTMEFWQK